MMNHIKFVCMIILCSILLVGCSSKGPKDPYQDEPADKIYKIGTEALEKKRYTKAIIAYESLDRQYPFGEDIEKAHLNMIYAYYRHNELPAALRAADRYIRLHPSSTHVDYAYYMRGLVKCTENIGFVARYLPLDLTQRDLNNNREAFAYFEEFVSRFSDSRYAPDARQRMVDIRNSLATAEMNVAHYYYKRGAYLASANRAQTVIESFPHTPATYDALQVMTDSYKKLTLDELAKQTAEVTRNQKGNQEGT